MTDSSIGSEFIKALVQELLKASNITKFPKSKVVTFLTHP